MSPGYVCRKDQLGVASRSVLEAGEVVMLLGRLTKHVTPDFNMVLRGDPCQQQKHSLQIQWPGTEHLTQCFYSLGVVHHIFHLFTSPLPVRSWIHLVHSGKQKGSTKTLGTTWANFSPSGGNKPILGWFTFPMRIMKTCGFWYLDSRHAPWNLTNRYQTSHIWKEIPFPMPISLVPSLKLTVRHRKSTFLMVWNPGNMGIFMGFCC